MFKKNWYYAFITAVLVALLILSFLIFLEKSKLLKHDITLLFFVIIITSIFSFRVLRLNHKSYMDAFFHGATTSIFTSFLGTIAILFSVSMIHHIKPENMFTINTIIVLLVFFLYLLFVSSIIPFITRNKWNKIKNEDILDSSH